MAKRKSRKVGPKKTWGCYVLDLRQDYEWAGEISFASRREGSKKYYDYEASGNATIEIRALSAYSDSKKVEIGTHVELSALKTSLCGPTKWPRLCGSCLIKNEMGGHRREHGVPIGA